MIQSHGKLSKVSECVEFNIQLWVKKLHLFCLQQNFVKRGSWFQVSECAEWISQGSAAT